MLISIKIPIQAHRGTGVGFYENKKDKTVARKQRQLSNKIEKFMKEVNSENFFGAPVSSLPASPTRPVPLRYGWVVPGHKYHVKLPKYVFGNSRLFFFQNTSNFISKYLEKCS